MGLNTEWKILRGSFPKTLNTVARKIIVISDRPDPPTDVLLHSCTSNSADVSWTAGSNNNDELLEYTVFYNTSHDTIITEANHTNSTTLKVRLVPWANYTFHVTARNAVGVSDRSAYTPGMCTTPQTKPFRHPSGVCSRSGGEPGQMVIGWQVESIQNLLNISLIFE